MAFDAERIKTRALALLGGGGETEGAALGPLSAAAGTELENRLRADVSAETLGERFDTAASLLALSLFVQTNGADGAGSVKAGRVTVSGASGTQRTFSAAALRREAETLLSDCLTDREFSFRGVRG